MAATEGNQWWRERSQHGRAAIFSSPTLMMDACCEYFAAEDADNNWQRVEVASFQGQIISESFRQKVPYTYEGLCRYLSCGINYFRQFRARVKKDISEGIDVEKNEEFSLVLDEIDAIIKEQQLKGAYTGHFKENITSKYLGMKDKTELSTPSEGEGEFTVTLNL